MTWPPNSLDVPILLLVVWWGDWGLRNPRDAGANELGGGAQVNHNFTYSWNVGLESPCGEGAQVWDPKAGDEGKGGLRCYTGFESRSSNFSACPERPEPVAEVERLLGSDRRFLVRARLIAASPTRVANPSPPDIELALACLNRHLLWTCCIRIFNMHALSLSLSLCVCLSLCTGARGVRRGELHDDGERRAGAGEAPEPRDMGEDRVLP